MILVFATASSKQGRVHAIGLEGRKHDTAGPEQQDRVEEVDDGTHPVPRLGGSQTQAIIMICDPEIKSHSCGSKMCFPALSIY